MKTPLVSIIVPAYNAENVVAATLQSAQQQTFSDFEAIIVDDGSTDGTSAVVETFVRRDPRFHLIRQKNGGVSAARNAALKCARGEWIAFLDADDLWLKEKLQRQLELAQQNPTANLLFTNYYIWDGEKDLGLRFERREKFPQGDVAEALLFFNLFGMSSVMVRREMIAEVGGFDPEVAPAEDWDMWLRIAEKRLVAVGVWEPQLRYRVWSGNASKNTARMAQSNVRVLEKALERPQQPAWHRACVRALKIARGNLELATGRSSIPDDPQKVSASILRAWRHCPARLKWLLWYTGTVWPKPLGGNYFTSLVHRKILSKW